MLFPRTAAEEAAAAADAADADASADAGGSTPSAGAPGGKKLRFMENCRRGEGAGRGRWQAAVRPAARGASARCGRLGWVDWNVKRVEKWRWIPGATQGAGVLVVEECL